jgi:uncharacterized surface protein with fasciclin (FAS1) repeats
LKTVKGAYLNFAMNGKQNIAVMDRSGNKANITTYDVSQNNDVCYSFAAKYR